MPHSLLTTSTIRPKHAHTRAEEGLRKHEEEARRVAPAEGPPHLMTRLRLSGCCCSFFVFSPPPPRSEEGWLPTASPCITCLLEGHHHKATRSLWPRPQAQCACRQPR